MMTMAGRRGRLHRDGEALDHVGAVAGDGGRRDRLDRAEVGAGVVFGDVDDEAGHDQADDAAIEQRRGGEHGRSGGERDAEADQPMDDAGDADERQDAGRDQALIERAHDRLRGAEPHEEGAGDRGDDADATDGERQRHHGEQIRRVDEEDRRQNHGGDDGHRIGLEQVGGHAGAVADVVADVVGDGRRITRIVFRNAGFDFADEIAADVGALGEDAAAETGEDRDQRGTEAERDNGVDHGAVVRRKMTGADEEAEIKRDAEQREASDQEAGDGAGLEGELEAAGKRLGRGLRDAHIGAHRHVHADETGSTREHRADQEADGDQPAEREAENEEDHHADHRNGGVLALEIGLRALAHGGGDFLHLGGAGIGAEHRHRRPDAVNDSEHATADDHPQCVHGGFNLD